MRIALHGASALYDCHAHYRSRRLERVGKTTLITKVIPRLLARGLTVSTLKHAHHGFDLDQPARIRLFHRTAGATEVIIPRPSALPFCMSCARSRVGLAHLVGKMSPVDLVLVEGYKRDAFSKLEIHRVAMASR